MEILQAGSSSEPEVLAARRIAQAAPGDGHAAEAELYRMLAPPYAATACATCATRTPPQTWCSTC